jgi:hypothetical protein
MSQIEIAQVLEQIKEEIEVDALGNGKASIRATARLAGVSDMAIIKALESANLEPSKLALMLMGHRFSAANLQEWRTNGIPDIAIGIILDYYAHEAGRYCTKQAKLVCRAFSGAGVRAWIQDIKGWSKATQQSNSTQPVQPPTPALAPVEQRLHTVVQAMRTLTELTGERLNPYLEQQFKDFVTSLLAEHNRQALQPSKERWLGAVNFAEIELGKTVPIKGSHYRGCLGKWVRIFYPHLGDRQETRLVNGVQQPIYVYACHEPTVAAGLTKAIEEFFAHPNPSAALRQAGAFASKKDPVLAK